MPSELSDEGLKGFVRTQVPKLLQRYRVERVVFFGSRVEGKSAEESDFDLIVISADFAGVRVRERMLEVALLVTPKGGHVDVLCYTPEEFARLLPISSFLRQCLETGLSIGAEELQRLAQSAEGTGQ
jgi:predicted nucleotidyltransferase